MQQGGVLLQGPLLLPPGVTCALSLRSRPTLHLLAGTSAAPGSTFLSSLGLWTAARQRALQTLCHSVLKSCALLSPIGREKGEAHKAQWLVQPHRGRAGLGDQRPEHPASTQAGWVHPSTLPGQRSYHGQMFASSWGLCGCGLCLAHSVLGRGSWFLPCLVLLAQHG